MSNHTASHANRHRQGVSCLECFRAQRERHRAQRLSEVPGPAFLRAATAQLTPEQTAHRWRMLANLIKRR